MNQIKIHILNRIQELEPKIQTAREQYRRTKNDGWAGRLQELTGRVAELEMILRKIGPCE